LPTIVAPLSDLDALRAATIDHDAYEALTGDREAKNFLVFPPEAREPENDLAVRMFAPGLGVLEDPATGSSNGCLAAYLARRRYFDEPSIAVDVDQGHEIDRPSRLHLRARDGGDEVTVEVGGGVVPVADGTLREVASE
jgi:trans-2,3-dihydro-3-hydroxyanthranilate isomerase